MRAVREQGDGLPERHEVSALCAFCFRLGVSGSGLSVAKLGSQLVDFAFEFHHASNSFEIQSLLGKLGDARQQLDVGIAVAPVTAFGASRLYETTTFVDAQRLWVHAGKLGRDRDDIDGGVVAALAHDDSAVTVLAAASC